MLHRPAPKPIQHRRERWCADCAFEEGEQRGVEAEHGVEGAAHEEAVGFERGDEREVAVGEREDRRAVGADFDPGGLRCVVEVERGTLEAEAEGLAVHA